MKPDAVNLRHTGRPISDALLAVEAEACRAVVANVFGYHALQISPWNETPDLLSTAQTVSRHHLRLGEAGRLSGCFSGQMLELPVQNESVSLAVLHHVHELLGGRHGLLSELHRILRPDGVVVMVGVSRWWHRQRPGFRPLSPSALAERLRGFDLQTMMVRPLSPGGRAMGSLVSAVTRRLRGAAVLGNLGRSWLLVARKVSRGSPVYPLRAMPLRGVEGPVRAGTTPFVSRPDVAGSRPSPARRGA